MYRNVPRGTFLQRKLFMHPSLRQAFRDLDEILINNSYFWTMKKKEINKDVVLKSVAKMLSNKESVLSYIKGKTTLNALTQKGIKFAKPL
jgi:hypothetical protein